MPDPRTLYDKLIDAHTVRKLDDRGHVLLYIDRQVLNEYTSPQAFSGLREKNRKVWRPQTALAVVDHVNPTTPVRTNAITIDAGSARQVSHLAENCRDFGIELFDVLDKRQGIEHVVMPEQGMILPGMVIASGDSHTTTYGAFGALGFGIGTSEIEHLLATQTLVYRRMKTIRVTVDGTTSARRNGEGCRDGAHPRDRCFGSDRIRDGVRRLRDLGTRGRRTHDDLQHDRGGRRARGDHGARREGAGLHQGPAPRTERQALGGGVRKMVCSARAIPMPSSTGRSRCVQRISNPLITWGTSPDQAVPIGGRIPDPATETDPVRRRGMERALEYMGLKPGMSMEEVKIDRAFIGSCTNARIEDLRDAARLLRGRRIAEGVRAMVVPGSTAVHDQAEAEGLDRIFLDAGFEWRQSGCSMCLAMNDDYLLPGERCASSTNRNFEGRQGAGGRTHLMSPAMVVAAAVTGHLADVRKLKEV